MDTDLQLLIQELKLKVAQLISQKKDLQTRLGALETDLELLQSELSEQKNTQKELKEQNKITKIAVALTNPSGTNKDLIQAINQYIREIDECIRLMSDSKL